MNPRERVLAATRGQAVDRVPCVAAFKPLYPIQRTAWNFPWPESASIEDRVAYQVETLRLDAVVTFGADLCRPADGVTSRAWVEQGLLHKVYETPVGRLRDVFRVFGRRPGFVLTPCVSAHSIMPWESTLAMIDEWRKLRGGRGSA